MAAAVVRKRSGILWGFPGLQDRYRKLREMQNILIGDAVEPGG
jgi:hypothetical protein